MILHHSVTAAKFISIIYKVFNSYIRIAQVISHMIHLTNDNAIGTFAR